MTWPTRCPKIRQILLSLLSLRSPNFTCRPGAQAPHFGEARLERVGYEIETIGKHIKMYLASDMIRMLERTLFDTQTHSGHNCSDIILWCMFLMATEGALYTCSLIVTVHSEARVIRSY